MMEALYESQLYWSSFLKTSVWLLAIYILMRLLSKWFDVAKLRKTGLRGLVRHTLKGLTYKLLLIYEPVVVLILITVLFLIEPVRHGLIIILLIIIGFPSLKNYLNGRILLLSTSLGQATRIETAIGRGVIARWERLGLYLQTTEGMRHVPYSHLMQHGYTLVSGERMGHLVELKLFATQTQNVSVQQLTGLISASPYLDLTYKPKVVAQEGESVDVTVRLRDEQYVADLVQVLAEWGWESKISHSNVA